MITIESNNGETRIYLNGLLDTYNEFVFSTNSSYCVNSYEVLIYPPIDRAIPALYDCLSVVGGLVSEYSPTEVNDFIRHWNTTVDQLKKTSKERDYPRLVLQRNY